MRLLWALVPILAIVEIAAQSAIPDAPPEGDWRAAASVIEAEKGPRDLVVIAPSWASQGRIFVGHLMTFEDFGRWDTTRYERIFEVAVDGARAPETEGQEREQEDRFGRITVRRYRLPPPAEVIYDFTARARRAKWDRTPKVTPRIVIDHWFNPRLAVPVRLRRSAASLTFEGVPLRGVIRGYGIIGYRSGRFNRGGPAKLAVVVEGRRLGEVSVHNFGPYEPFEFPIPEELGPKGRVRFEVLANDALQREFGFAADVRVKGGAR